MDPRLVGRGTVTHCSRDFKPVSGTPKCNIPCELALGEGENLTTEGNATVIGDPNCIDKITVDARVYFTALTSDMMNEIILSAHSPQIFKLNTAGTIE
jgi:hypothetical protein